MANLEPLSSHFDADEIVVTAVSEFWLRPRPLRADIARLVDLVMPLLSSMSATGRRSTAAALGGNAFAPKILLRALCDYPVSECASVLTRSNLLNSAELLAIVSQHGAEHARAIARRTNLDTSVVTALRALNDEGVDRALDLRQRAIESPAETDTINSVPAADAPQARPAKQAFDRIQTVLEKDPAEYARPLSRPDIRELVVLAGNDNKGFLHTAIADTLAVTLASAAALCANPGSKNLLYMLRFLDAPTPRAFELFVALAPELAVKKGVPARFTDVYESITPVEAAAKVRGWRSDDLIALAREALAANQPGQAPAQIEAGQDNIRDERHVA